MTIRYTEHDGTSGADGLIGANSTVTFGLQGNDVLVATPNPTAGEVFIGGPGSDVYFAEPNSTMTIADMGDGAPNTIVATGIGTNDPNGFAAIIDGRHFAAVNFSTGEAVVIIDWLDPRNKLDTIQLSDGTFTFDQLATAVNTGQLGSHFLGNITWAQSGLVPVGHTTAEIQEAVSYYEQRAASLISAPPINPAEQVLIDPNFYLAQNPDVAQADADPSQHYAVMGGWQQGWRNPDAFFNTAYYLQHNPDVAAAGIDPLLHYALFGWHEGRDPSAAFSTSDYLAKNPDVRLAGVDPLQHYLQFGIAEHRSI